jgi:hypothetical protein
MKVSARARPRCCGGTPPSQGGSTGSIPVGRSTAQHNASPSVVLVSERLDFQGRGSRVRSPSPAPIQMTNGRSRVCARASGRIVDHLRSELRTSRRLLRGCIGVNCWRRAQPFVRSRNPSDVREGHSLGALLRRGRLPRVLRTREAHAPRDCRASRRLARAVGAGRGLRHRGGDARRADRPRYTASTRRRR